MPLQPTAVSAGSFLGPLPTDRPCSVARTSALSQHLVPPVLELGACATEAPCVVLGRRAHSQRIARVALAGGGAVLILHAARRRHFSVPRRWRRGLGTQAVAVAGRAVQADVDVAGASMTPVPVGLGEDIVQFDSAVYFVEEEEGSMNVDIIRMGTMEDTISVDYNTEDGSAVAGSRYEAVSGTLVFPPGCVYQTLTIPLIDNDKWDTTLEFKIRLTNPRNCELGRYLYLSRVKVIDGDFFPTSRFQEEMERCGSSAQGLSSAGVSGLDLLLEYCKLNLETPGIKEKSLGILVIDQLQNLYFLLTTYVVQYAADDVLGSSAANADDLLVPGNKEETLFLLAFIYVAPFVALNLLDLWKAQQKIAETSRGNLQQSIFRKFLNYDEMSRSSVTSGELGLSIISDADDIVSSGYMNVFELLKQFGKLVVSIYFIVNENPDALLPTVLVAVAIAVFISLNYEKSAELREEVSERQERILDVCQEASGKIGLISDFKVRPLLEDNLEQRINELNVASVPLSTSQVINDYFPSWLSNLLVAGYLAYGGQAVLNGSCQIGTFLATVNICKEISDTFKDIFTASLELSKATGPIVKVTALLNKKTNLRDQKKINRRRRQVTKQERSPENLAELRRKSGQRYGTDAIPIRLENLTFAYPGDAPKLSGVSLSVEQGTLVAVVGPRRGGKSTLVKLLGQVLDPLAGEIFMPSYLRILHVGATPVILEGSIWRNLTIGSINYWRDAEFESKRAMTICRRLGFNSRFMSLLEDTREQFIAGVDDQIDNSWSMTLSISDQMLVHLARAFVYNPEVLVINRPTSQLPENLAEVVFELLREFVDNRGIELPASAAGKRRPRTAFVSFARPAGVKNSDVVWVVEGGMVKQAAKEDISELLIQ